MKQRIRWRSWGLAGFRALLLIAIFACFHRAASRSWSVVNPTDKLLTLAQVLPYFPSATSISEDSSSLWQKVLDHNDDTLGTVIQTSPESDSIIGFSGSSNTLVAFDKEGTVMNLAILTSGDTDDHVDQVRENARFMGAITGKSWEDLAQISGIEGVSGATLTSQAVLESIIRRTGGSTPSLRFPTSITLSEAQDFFPQAATLETESRAFLAVKDSIGTPLGYVARSSPHSDSFIGYQGPTDTLVVFDLNKHVIGIRPRKSFDTKNYLKSIEIDDYFLKSFNGQTLETLATLDLLEAGIEGVSGATMTSMTMADGVLAMAKHLKQEPTVSEVSWWRKVSPHQYGTIVITLFGVVMAVSRLRGVRWVRVTFQALLIGYLGFHNGHLISQALLAGWASHGPPWRLAPGLVFLTIAAFVVPLVSGKQVYCHQLCPHGAAQQWLKGRSRWKWQISPALDRALRGIPILLIAITVIATIRAWPVNLADIEAFDAYLYPIVGFSALLIAIVGLAISTTVPMAYCRYGCPTGALLNFVRRRGTHDRFHRRDVIALGLLATAFFLTSLS